MHTKGSQGKGSELEVVFEISQILRHQLYSSKQSLAKLEAEVLIYKARAQCAEKEKENLKVHNIELLEILDKEKKEKTMLLVKVNDMNYNQTRENIEVKRSEQLVKSLTQENQALKAALQMISQQKTNYTKEKQELMTKQLLLESKAEMALSQQEVIQTLNKSLTTLDQENVKLRKQISSLKKELAEGARPMVTAVLKNDGQAVGQLIRQFETKLAMKEQEHSAAREQYEQKIKQLNIALGTRSGQPDKATL